MKKYLQQKEQEYLRLENLAKKSLASAPSGSLRASCCRGKYPQYYLLDASSPDSKPQYLSKSQSDLARRLAQKEYDTALLHCLKQQIKIINRFIKLYNDQSVEAVYSNLPLAKQQLVTPYTTPTDQFIQQWKAAHPQNQNTFEIRNGFRTARGEIVRSKSEKIQADTYFMKNIPYAYESALKLPDGNVIYPDFTLLNVRLRKTYYHEHQGMMDKPDYANDALNRINLYIHNGINPYETLLITQESSRSPFNVSYFEWMIRQYLL